MKAIDPSTLLSVAQAAKRIPYSEPALRNRIERGEVEVHRIDGRIYVTEAELRAKFGDLYPPPQIKAA